MSRDPVVGLEYHRVPVPPDMVRNWECPESVYWRRGVDDALAALTPLLKPRTAGPLSVGDVVHGFCGGILGRDHYECSRVDTVGPGWAVLRGTESGSLCLAYGDDLAKLAAYLEPVADTQYTPGCGCGVAP